MAAAGAEQPTLAILGEASGIDVAVIEPFGACALTQLSAYGASKCDERAMSAVATDPT
jgi:hypothetical protein